MRSIRPPGNTQRSASVAWSGMATGVLVAVATLARLIAKAADPRRDEDAEVGGDE